jgi:hypothetical protein
VQVECHYHQNILRKVYNFLKNPFFRQYNYECPTYARDRIKLPMIGDIDVPLQLKMENHDYLGFIGLSSNSGFIKNLPEKYQTFSIFISRIDFGGY